MRLRAPVLTALIAVLLASTAGVAGAAEGDGSKKGSAKVDVSKCVSVRTEAIYGAYGYDHHVHLHNGCDKAVRCEVTTNSNPEITTVILGKGEGTDVLMFRGSPASQVTANVKCRAADDGG